MSKVDIRKKMRGVLYPTGPTTAPPITKITKPTVFDAEYYLQKERELTIKGANIQQKIDQIKGKTAITTERVEALKGGFATERERIKNLQARANINNQQLASIRQRLSEAKKATKAKDTEDILKTVKSTVSKAGDEYENVFRTAVKPLDNAIKGIYTASSEAASKREYGKAATLYSVGIMSKGLRGVYEGLTFFVRPTKWKETAEFLGNVLTPEKGETVQDYRNRVRQIVAGDIADPLMREEYTQQILKTMPESPTRITKEQREYAQVYKQALAAAIMEDPIGFLAEVAGGYVGGNLFLKAVKKLPGVKRAVTSQSLEARMWAKCTPIDEIETTVPEIHTPVSDWSISKLPRGTWRSTWEIAKDTVEKGGTAVVMLADPKTGKISSYLTWVEVTKLTNGLPEAMGGIGALTAIPVVIKTDELNKRQQRKVQNNQPNIDYYDRLHEERKNQLILFTTPSMGELKDQLEKELSKSKFKDLTETILEEDEDQTILIIPNVPPIETIRERGDEDEEIITEPIIEEKPIPKPTPEPTRERTEEETIQEILEEEIQITEGDEKERRKRRTQRIKDKRKRIKEEREKLAPGEHFYTVKFTDYDGRSETHKVPAKSFQQAYSKAYHIRRWHGLQHEVELIKGK